MIRLAALTLCAFLTPSAFAVAPPFPQLFFEIGVLDMWCNTTPEKPITPEMKKELADNQDHLQTLWNARGPDLLKQTIKLLGPEFGRKEESVALTLCPWFPPMSSPLMIRMRDFLKSSRPDPRPDFYFAALVFHEMLHRYLEKNFNRFLDERRSPLFQKYASEHGGVLVHIHLFGVLKTIYIQLKLEGELEKIIEWDSEIAGPVYKRSWEIVNTEGHEKFVNELKGPRPGRNH